MIEAYITNLGRYNEGYLISEPLKFPTTTEEVQALLKRIGVNGIRYEGYFLTEYKTDIPGLHKCLGEYESIDELNYLASLLGDMQEWETEKFTAAVDFGEYNSVKDLINLAQNLDCFEFYHGIEDEEDLGRYYIEEMCTLEVPEHLKNYIDYEAYGRDMDMDEDGRFVDGGYVVRTGDSLTEYYCGRDDLPEEHRIFAYPEPEKSIKKTLEYYQQMMGKSTSTAHERPHPVSAERQNHFGSIWPEVWKGGKPMAKKNPANEPIAENEYVKELLAILRENNAPSAKDFLAVLQQVGAMERQLDTAVKELAAMRQELQAVQEQNHPVKSTMQKAVISMQGQVLDLREQLTGLKQNIIDGCKNALAAFKEKGISALDSVARFFKVRPMLESMRDDLDSNIRSNDKTIAKIEAISTEYHEAGRHLKNMGRAMLGKESIQKAHPPGKLAAVISAPFRAERSHLADMKKSVEKAIGAMIRLEERAAEKKPSIREAINTHNQKVAKETKNAPTAERPRPASAERQPTSGQFGPKPSRLYYCYVWQERRFFMQEDIERRTVALSVNASKLTGRALAKVLASALQQMQKGYQKRQTPQGRQSVKKLMNHGVSTNSLDLSGDTRLFDRMARKYNVDYAFHKTGPDKYLLFFKAGQADAITACFGEYTKLVMSRGKHKRPSILQQLKQFADKERSKPRHQERKREAVRNER